MKSWWGQFDLSKKKSLLQKQIGPLRFAINQDGEEWLIYYDRLPDWLDEALVHAKKDEPITLDAETLKERYVLSKKTSLIDLLPALADRSVVARPATPFYVPSQQTVSIYISTPLWVKIRVGVEAVELTEIPILRPSDTWFGPNTRQGELCYASRTSARLSMVELPKRTYRAITPVLIHNESDSHLLLERINLPVPYLELYETAERLLWTQGVTIVRKKKDESDVLEILDGAPDQLQEAELIAGPRQKSEQKNIIGAISGFFA